MCQAGVDVRLKTSHLGSVGVQESLPHLRSLRRAYQSMQELVKSEKPDVAVLVDNETFSMALARHFKNRTFQSSSISRLRFRCGEGGERGG